VIFGLVVAEGHNTFYWRSLTEPKRQSDIILSPKGMHAKD